MNYDDKVSIGLRLVAEVIFIIAACIILAQIIGYDAEVRHQYGIEIIFFNAISFISFDHFRGIQLFLKSLLLVMLTFVGTFMSFKTSYTNMQTLLTAALTITNILFLGKIVLALSNPILLALFFLAIIGMAFSVSV